MVTDTTSWERLFHLAIVHGNMTSSCTAYGGRELSYLMSWIFLMFVFCGLDNVGRYSELIEMVPVLYIAYFVLSSFGGLAFLTTGNKK